MQSNDFIPSGGINTLRAVVVVGGEHGVVSQDTAAANPVGRCLRRLRKVQEDIGDWTPVQALPAPVVAETRYDTSRKFSKVLILHVVTFSILLTNSLAAKWVKSDLFFTYCRLFPVIPEPLTKKFHNSQSGF